VGDGQDLTAAPSNPASFNRGHRGRRVERVEDKRQTYPDDHALMGTGLRGMLDAQEDVQVGGEADRELDRELEVLGLLTRGFSNAEIGKQLFLSEATRSAALTGHHLCSRRRSTAASNSQASVRRTQLDMPQDAKGDALSCSQLH
jgi:Bacterial regulatory proteins, luxR family